MLENISTEDLIKEIENRKQKVCENFINAYNEAKEMGVEFINEDDIDHCIVELKCKKGNIYYCEDENY